MKVQWQVTAALVHPLLRLELDLIVALVEVLTALKERERDDRDDYVRTRNWQIISAGK
jgi:hypothetical protein